jgi:hypothetical protein
MNAGILDDLMPLAFVVSAGQDLFEMEVFVMGQRVDRRVHKRFKVRDESFAFIENGSKILCKIKNISKGGVSLVTIANAEHIPELFDTDIFVTGRVFYLKDVPSKKVSEAHLDAKSLFSTFVKSRVGIQFGDLNNEQATQLEVFLKNHATIEDVSEL